ncbi:MAG TPA: 16S rRNA (cytidine(1402)-2'-O)-methyltransferase [Vicinamibacterales bacterium]|nr:16S rRNA (cytidine(1402)-2'-O)-methyltransferase [Vicinamibacterales bacterium]
MPGTLFVVATPIGNLEDITLRALRVLREVAVIAAEDTRRTAHLLARHAIATPTTSLHEHNETIRSVALVDRLRRGDNVALVSDAGTPTVSDPGATLIRAALDAGIRVEPIPGPSAVLAALTASGFETDSFAFLGFPPTKVNARNAWFERLAAIGGTIVFFEAPHRILETLGDLRRVAGDCEVAIGREMTKAHEEVVKGQISYIIQQLGVPRGEFTVVANVPESGTLASEPADLVAEFGEMTANHGLTRRKAIGVLARRHGIAPNDVYARLERAKKSVK